MVVHPAFWQVVSRATLGPEVYCLNWSKLWGTWFLDWSAKNTSVICHNLSRIRPAGKVVKEGTAKLGLTRSGKSTFLANDKSLGKLIFGHLGNEGVPICFGDISHGSGDRNRGGEKEMCSQPMEPNMERQTQGQES